MRIFPTEVVDVLLSREIEKDSFRQTIDNDFSVTFQPINDKVLVLHSGISMEINGDKKLIQQLR